MESTLLEQETLLKSRFISLVDALLAHGHNQFRVRGNFLAHLDRLGHQFFWRKNSTNETCFKSYENVSIVVKSEDSGRSYLISQLLEL